MSYVANGTPSAQRWNNYDRETALKTNAAGQQVVAHGASAKANFKAVGKDLLDMIDPTNHFRSTWESVSRAPGLAMSLPLFILMIPWNVMGEVADLVAKPVQAVKDFSDGVAHSVMAGIEVFSAPAKRDPSDINRNNDLFR